MSLTCQLLSVTVFDMSQDIVTVTECHTKRSDVMVEIKERLLSMICKRSDAVTSAKKIICDREEELSRYMVEANEIGVPLREIAECTHLHHTTISKRIRAYRKGE